MYSANHPPVYLMGRKRGSQIFPNLELHPEDETIPGLLIVRTEGMLTFASCPRAVDTFQKLIAERDSDVLLLDLSAVPDIEYTALVQLQEAEQKMAEKGVSVWMAGLNQRALESIRRTSLGEGLQQGRLFDSVSEAVESYLSKCAR